MRLEKVNYYQQRSPNRYQTTVIFTYHFRLHLYRFVNERRTCSTLMEYPQMIERNIVPDINRISYGNLYRFEYDIFVLSDTERIGCLIIYTQSGKYITHLQMNDEDHTALVEAASAFNQTKGVEVS